jgi:hypothetical protein
MFPAYGSMYVQTITKRKGSKQKSAVNKEYYASKKSLSKTSYRTTFPELMGSHISVKIKNVNC